MTAQLWDGQSPVLADTSAWIVALRVRDARARFLAGIERGDIAWCWPVRYELMIDARDSDAIVSLDRTLEGVRQIATDAAVQRGVLAVMRELAGTGSQGSHRFPLTDLAVAVAAQQAGIDILHHDRHFERLGELLGVRALWIADPTD
ncbi:MAG: PIN domain-containing protein [Solirubrobacteraceae bacterium]